MADDGGILGPLDLLEEFPPVSTADWEAAIQADLAGADYEKRLVWQTDEGIAVKPYYRREHGNRAAMAPGEFPFTRGAGPGWEIAQHEELPQDAVRADWFLESGATAVHELAWAISWGVDMLTRKVDEGQSVDDAARSIHFVFGIGSNFFFEIAKLRAARWLWAQAVMAFEPADPQCAQARILAKTAASNKTLYDPYTNLLRATTETLSAAMGGADSIIVRPAEFHERLAENVHFILKEEAHIDGVADPLGGSYYVEALTDELARLAWEKFQALEVRGGYGNAFESGLIKEELERQRDARKKAIATRRRTMVGVNNYPDLQETEIYRLSPPRPGSGPFRPLRLAEDFENIRLRSEAHTQITGERPTVLLLTRGDRKMRAARANFCANLFGCGGFRIVESDKLERADMIVLCSSDAEYLEFARDICAATDKPVAVAGYPKDQVGKLQAMGVEGFVYLGCDAVETLRFWQDMLEVTE